MSNTLNIRCSRLDRAWICAESLNPGEPSIETPSEPADLGSAFHEWSRTRDTSDQSEIATRYSVSADELDRLIAYSMIAERDLKAWFHGAAPERALVHEEPWDCPPYDKIRLTGSIDRSEVLGESAAILDYKTGRVDTGYEHQQRGYGFLMIRAEPRITEVKSATVYVAHGYWKPRTYKVESLESWWFDFKRRLANGIGRFSPGSHCGFCPRRPTCPGVYAYERSALAIATSQDPEVFETELTVENKAIVGPQLAERRSSVSFIAKRCEEFMSVLRAKVIEVGGEIPAGDGKVLKIIKVNRRTLDAQKAWPVLARWLKDEQIAGVCKISLSKCQEIVGKEAPHGTKGAVRKQLADDLEESGAVIPGITEQLREVAG